MEGGLCCSRLPVQTGLAELRASARCDEIVIHHPGLFGSRCVEVLRNGLSLLLLARELSKSWRSFAARSGATECRRTGGGTGRLLRRSPMRRLRESERIFVLRPPRLTPAATVRSARAAAWAGGSRSKIAAQGPETGSVGGAGSDGLPDGSARGRPFATGARDRRRGTSGRFPRRRMRRTSEVGTRPRARTAHQCLRRN